MSDERLLRVGRSVSQTGEKFYLYKERWSEDLRATVKEIIDPSNDQNLTERIALCTNALIGVPSEAISDLLAANAPQGSTLEKVSHAIRERGLRGALKRIRARAAEKSET